jgi:hypothetical protein
MLAALALPSIAPAQLTCDGTILLDYVNPPGRPLQVGDVLHVKGSFGSGPILGGTFILYNKVQFDLDCDTSIPLVPPCQDLGPIISYNGDASITTNCPGITWTSNLPGGGFLPNQIEFDASPVLQVAPNIANPPGFCSLNFDVTVQAVPASNSVGEILGYKIALCDNGLTSGGFQTAAATFAPPLQHYDCYETPRAGIPARNVTLTDRFGTTNDRIVNFLRLCAPADKNGENPGAESDPLHYASATISRSSGFTKRTGITVGTQFGTYTVDVVAPIALLLPASKGLNGFLPPLDGEHFQCYRLSNVKGPAPKGIHVTDQFVDALRVDVNPRGPDRLCVAADKNGETGTFSTNALMCIRTKNDALPFGEKNLFLTTQFGQKKVKITQYDELCVPATVLGGD